PVPGADPPPSAADQGRNALRGVRGMTVETPDARQNQEDALPSRHVRDAPAGSGRPARRGGVRRVTEAAESDPLWYKDAIIYEVHVRAFRDSNGDGRGDFRGLTEKLDYLRDLGVTAIWVLPFYPSPLKDDGYDIAD